MRRNRFFSAALIAALPMLGSCLSNESFHDLYLDPDGSVVWTITEREVRSSAQSADERRREEREYLEAVRADDHAAARALLRIGARRVRTTVVRDERPYTVTTSGAFNGIDEALGRLLDGLGVRHEIELDAPEDGTLVLELAIEDGAGAEPDEAVLPLATVLGDSRIVLTSGVFVEAAGFELEQEATVARMSEPAAANGVLRYRLVWRPDES